MLTFCSTQTATDVLCVKAQLNWAGVSTEKLSPCT